MPDELEANARALAAELGVDYTPAALEVAANRARARARARELRPEVPAGEELPAVVAVCPACAADVPAPDGAARVVFAEWAPAGALLTDTEGRYWPVRHTCATWRARRRYRRLYPLPRRAH